MADHCPGELGPNGVGLSSHQRPGGQAVGLPRLTQVDGKFFFCFTADLSQNIPQTQTTITTNSDRCAEKEGCKSHRGFRE